MGDHYDFIDALNSLTHPQHRAIGYLKQIDSALKFGELKNESIEKI